MTVGEIKVFPDRGGHTDPQQLATARAQAGIYRHALQLRSAALGPHRRVDVAADGFLVFTWPGSNSPSVRADEDLTYQAIRAERGFDRLEEVAQSSCARTTSPPTTPRSSSGCSKRRHGYGEACLSFCDLAPRCHPRAVSADDPIVLGDEVKRLLGDTTVSRAIELLNGAEPADEREADLQRQLARRMSVREIAQKLRAWEAGRPLPRYDTIHHAVMSPEQALLVAFVRMAGESRPWGIAWGTAGSEPRIETVPDGRVRDDVAGLVRRLRGGPARAPARAQLDIRPRRAEARAGELRQVWLPNGQHVAMLHQLSYAYSQTKFGGMNQEILRALGRLAGWMFRDTSRRGNQHVVSASRLWRGVRVPGAGRPHSASRLPARMADDAGDRDARIAAASDAESLTVSPTMDPSLERDDAEPRSSKTGRRAAARARTRRPAASAIADVLAPNSSGVGS